MNENTRQLARRFYEIVNQAMRTGDVGLFDSVLAPTAVDHDPTPGMAPGREGIKRAFAEVQQRFRDYRGEVQDIMVEGDKAACRVMARMTHRGKELTLRGIDILRFENGLLVERWGQFQTPPD
jgi:predicted SnoaL-like aldol condensation-catalyzing enzyme